MEESNIRIKRAIISCWDKTGLLPLANKLAENGVEILSSGGTARFLQENGIPVTLVEDVTGFPEMLDGRVKTLHPHIHGAILARRTEAHLQELAARGIQPLDLVVVNLYPFLEKLQEGKTALEEMLEAIDIGGPTLLRAAAKNFRHVVALFHPHQYREFLELYQAHEGGIPVAQSRRWAAEVFFHISYYDARIASFLTPEERARPLPGFLGKHLVKEADLRYGENPHQRAALYQFYPLEEKRGASLEQLGGKEMSFNNYVDVAAAADLVREFSEPGIAIIKHTNPCGAAVADNLAEAFQRALAGDPLSAFGGIIAANRVVDAVTAENIVKTFFECVIAPDFSADALQVLKKKKNLRILRTNLFSRERRLRDYRYTDLGVLVQEVDRKDLDAGQLQSVGSREPDEREREDLYFAWKIVKHVKSNAIVFVKDRQLLGVGAGQMSRVDAVKLAKMKAAEAGHSLAGAVMASDAFFPFPDGVEVAAEAGIRAVIQPGGSIRDQEVIKTARNLGMAMLLTGIRHFKH